MKKDLINKTITSFKKMKDNLSYNYDENYTKLINTAVDYDNETNHYLYLYDTIRDTVDFVEYESLSYHIGKCDNDISRLRFFIGDTRGADLYKLNGYGNLENVDNDDFLMCIDACLDKLSNELNIMQNKKSVEMEL